jgi:hypothetical protein
MEDHEACFNHVPSVSPSVVGAVLGLISLTSVSAGVVQHRLELGLAQITTKHLRVALCGVVHAGLGGSCSNRK